MRPSHSSKISILLTFDHWENISYLTNTFYQNNICHWTNILPWLWFDGSKVQKISADDTSARWQRAKQHIFFLATPVCQLSTKCIRLIAWNYVFKAQSWIINWAISFENYCPQSNFHERKQNHFCARVHLIRIRISQLTVTAECVTL